MIKTKDLNALSASTIIGGKVRNHQGEGLGEIEDFVVDMQSGRIAYAVLSFDGFLGMGGKLFAVPFQSLSLNLEKEEFILDADKDKLKNAPGFDRDNWPMMGNRRWGSEIHAYYGRKPYWE
ncbi:MAG: PRC-barrel domain-containing protein [Acidobacteriota bacterium]